MKNLHEWLLLTFEPISRWIGFNVLLPPKPSLASRRVFPLWLCQLRLTPFSSPSWLIPNLLFFPNRGIFFFPPLSRVLLRLGGSFNTLSFNINHSSRADIGKGILEHWLQYFFKAFNILIFGFLCNELRLVRFSGF